MLINPRLPLLCVVVGSFMGLWSGDKQVSLETVIAQAQAAKRQVYVQSETVPVVVPQAKPVVDTYEETPAPHVVSNDEAYEQELGMTHLVATTVTRTVAEDLELPKHIAPGFYRAVNHQGQAKIVQVCPTAKNINAAVRDFHMHETNDQRWYLIRLDIPSVASLPEMFLQ